MNVAIIGTRGIPNYYGGFEQFAEYLSVGLVEKGHKVTVYNSHTHPYQEKEFKGVRIIHCKDPEGKIGTAGQFIYDLNCILDARSRGFDIILQLGYTSSSIWSGLFPKGAVLTTNMDGLEWKRTKYSPRVRQFLTFAERLAVKYSDHLIADSVGIQSYLKTKYKKDSTYIPYGAYVFEDPNPSVLATYDLTNYGYNLLIARLEPENSIETILTGVAESSGTVPFLVIGKHETAYGAYLKDKFSQVDRIRFLGGIYDQAALNNLRYYSNLYFHGHTVGGTNPSLLEAMASEALICAHQNEFNASILGEDAFYFTEASEVRAWIESVKKQDHRNKIHANLAKIDTLYRWDRIISQYLDHFQSIIRLPK